MYKQVNLINICSMIHQSVEVYRNVIDIMWEDVEVAGVKVWLLELLFLLCFYRYANPTSLNIWGMKFFLSVVYRSPGSITEVYMYNIHLHGWIKGTTYNVYIKLVQSTAYKYDGH